MRILFAGTPAVAVTVLGGLVNSGHEVVGVLTREDAPVGRRQLITSSPVADYALTRSIPVIKANSLGEAELARIKELKPDLAIVVAYGSILKAEALEVLSHGWFNLHFSLLPRYRGAAPVQHCLINGDEVTGVTLFKIDLGMDTGAVLSQVPTKVEADETSGFLLQRLAHLGITLLNEELPRIYAGIHSLSTQEGTPSSAPKIARKDAKINFSGSAQEIINLIRAMNPEPGAWTQINNEPIRIFEARISSESVACEAGAIVKVQDSVLVGCGDERLIELHLVQPAGRKLMSASDWLRGHQQLVKFDK
jgi:methionyl-tRNA formyltransferase